MKIVIAPDSFKGTASQSEVSKNIESGWRSVRPQDEIVLLPMADGGEGTLETIASLSPDSIKVNVKVNYYQDKIIDSHWLLLKDGTAIVELAVACGLTLMERLDPLGAHTYGFGQLLKSAASDKRVKKIIACVGGSASTDGGSGAIAALGAKMLDSRGADVVLGGAGLTELAQIQVGQVIPAPAGGLTILVDVNNPLLGSEGAAKVFSPQKGALPSEIEILENGLLRFQQVSNHSDFTGAGAAGGTPFGLSLIWPTTVALGSVEISKLIGLESAISECDILITGEGRFDTQSLHGKVVGTLIDIAQRLDKQYQLCVGSSEIPLHESGVSLSDLAGSKSEAMQNPKKWLINAGIALASKI